MFCRKCGNVLPDDARFCPYCGEDRGEVRLSAPPCREQGGAPQAVYGAAQDWEKPINNLGLGGMIVGIVGIWTCWVIVVGLIVGVVGVVLSALALSRRARYRMNGFAVAGLILSIIALLPTVLAVVVFVTLYFAFTGPGGAGVV